MAISFDDPYLHTGLITYIGNKRRLRHFLGATLHSLFPDADGRVFLDPFAGSGAVSRLARSLGFRVHANDWEPYAQIVNQAALTLDPGDVERLFQPYGGFSNACRMLVDEAGDVSPYIALHYAPKQTGNADYRRERLFYTAENAAYIDRFRTGLDRFFPVGSEGDARVYLLASLLVEASIHANTSGVFKACHKGFGGHGRDALSRILAPICPEPIPVIPGRGGNTASGRDAAEFLLHVSGDVCYLDPPYNIHQYGSNYHLLNTIALWDRPPIPPPVDAAGKRTFKAGIRADWTRTRSDFCYAKSASPAFRSVIDRIDSRYLLVSYNTDGLISPEEMIDILSTRGETRLLSSDYVKFRGGKVSLTGVSQATELLFVTDTARQKPLHIHDEWRKTLLVREFLSLFRLRMNPDRIRDEFPAETGNSGDIVIGTGLRIASPDGYRYSVTRFNPDCFSYGELEDLRARFDRVCLKDRFEEVCILIPGIESADNKAKGSRLRSLLLSALGKLGTRKNAGLYHQAVERIHRSMMMNPQAWQDDAFTTRFEAGKRIVQKRLDG